MGSSSSKLNKSNFVQININNYNITKMEYVSAKSYVDINSADEFAKVIDKFWPTSKDISEMKWFLTDTIVQVITACDIMEPKAIVLDFTKEVVGENKKIIANVNYFGDSIIFEDLKNGTLKMYKHDEFKFTVKDNCNMDVPDDEYNFSNEYEATMSYNYNGFY